VELEMTSDSLLAAIRQAGIELPQGLLEFGPPEQTMFTLKVPGAEAIATWRKLRSLIAQTGHWPAVLGSAEDLDNHRHDLEISDVTTERILELGNSIDAEAWLERRAMDQIEDFGLDPDVEGLDAMEAGGFPHGDWPEHAPRNDQFTIPREVLSGRFHPEVFIGLFPSHDSWHVPAFLRFGGWNDCPEPEAHVAILRHSNSTHGAELVGATSDVIELHVARPPRDRVSALSLANQQYRYCYDIVEQGTGSIEALAATLLGAPVWYFWWD
jgi:hypothetical protein